MELSESQYIDLIVRLIPWNQYMEIQREVRTAYGCIDILIKEKKLLELGKTHYIIIEVKTASNLQAVRSAFGQLLFYKTAYPEAVLYICCDKPLSTKFLDIVHKYDIKDCITQNRYLTRHYFNYLLKLTKREELKLPKM